MRQNLIKLHAASATIALLLISTFFLSSLVSEIIGDKALIITVKTYIFYAIWILLPTMAIAGITGNKLAPNAKSGVIGMKKKRMPFIAANGVLILIPAAIFLKSTAVSGTLDTTFYTVQIIELLAGFINISLMTLNLRDGLSIAKNRKAKLKK
jgi:hypothetical protein